MNTSYRILHRIVRRWYTRCWLWYDDQRANGTVVWDSPLRLWR